MQMDPRIRPLRYTALSRLCKITAALQIGGSLFIASFVMKPYVVLPPNDVARASRYVAGRSIWLSKGIPRAQARCDGKHPWREKRVAFL